MCFCRVPISRLYDEERTKLALDRQVVANHPLLPSKKIAPKRASVSPSASSSSLDPLSSTPLDVDPLSAAVNDDPLSMMLSGGDNGGSTVPTKKVELRRQGSEVKQVDTDSSSTTPWQIKKQQIIRDYTIIGNITIGASTFNEFAGSGVEDGSSSRKVDIYSRRLANLEKRNVTDDKIELTQKEYEAHILKLTADLDRAWSNDERVQSLKIAIQLAKLLADTNVPTFYPSMFVMVTNVLEKFGDMVFARLKSKAEEGLIDPKAPPTKRRPKLPENFSAADVPVNAKETCRNWFYKTACIRELLPRIYVEISLLKCFRFLADTEYPQILSRLGSLIRGVGDPMVSLYARTYLLVMGMEVAPQVSQYAYGLAQDTLTTFQMFKQSHHTASLRRCGISQKDYLHSMSPGIEWVMRSVGRNASKEVFQGLLQHYREVCNDSLVLKFIIESFDGSHYCHAALGMVALIKSSEQVLPILDLYSSLGKQLAAHPPPEEHRIPLLNEIWKVVSKTEELGPVIRCTSAWIEALIRHYSERELLIVLADLTSKLSNNPAAADLNDADTRHLEALLYTLLSHSSTIGSSVLTSDNVLKILDMFKGSRRVELSKDVLDSFKNHPSTNDAVLIHTMFDIGRTLHDSLDSLSPEGEKRHIASIICAFLDKIDFGKDLEQQLNVYVECRAIFSNLDMVKDKLILCVCSLAVKAFSYMRGKHSKKTAAFAKACLAYCHITTPSINAVYRKLQLLLHCAEVALLNQCLPQTDVFLKAAISLIPEVPPYEELDNKRVHTEEKLCNYLLSLLSTLVVVPGHPEHGPFYIVQGLFNALPRYPWQPATPYKTKVYIGIFALLCTFYQRKFPYHISHVESNDSLYGGRSDYKAELATFTKDCIQEILAQLAALGERTEASAKVNQARLCLDLVNQVAYRITVTAEVAELLVKFVELACKHKASFTTAEKRYLISTAECLKLRADSATGGAALIHTAMRVLLS